MHTIVLHLFELLFIVSLSVVIFPVDPVTAVEPEIIGAYPFGDPFSSCKATSKQPLLDHSEITHSFSLLLALDFAITV